LWVHDSDHPVAKIFNTGDKVGGSYQDYNTGVKSESFLAANLQYYIGKPFLQKPYLDHLQKALIAYHQEVKDLSWSQLLDKIADYKQQDVYLVELRNVLTGAGHVLDKVACQYIGLDPQSHDFKNNAIKLLGELGIGINTEAITGSRYYSGSGDEHYLPHAGY
jgi:hypothetical protein